VSSKVHHHVTESNEQQSIAEPDYGPGLRIIRKRRWYLWLEILVYVPAMWVTLKVAPSNIVIGMVFAIWFIMLWIVVGVSALARCPRCGNYFHMNGMTLIYLRKCLHCQLHLKADKKKKK
jgi:hypothetical protein